MSHDLRGQADWLAVAGFLANYRGQTRVHTEFDLTCFPAESLTLGLSHLQFGTLLSTARDSENPNGPALVCMLGRPAGAADLRGDRLRHRGAQRSARPPSAQSPRQGRQGRTHPAAPSRWPRHRSSRAPRSALRGTPSTERAKSQATVTPPRGRRANTRLPPRRPWNRVADRTSTDPGGSARGSAPGVGRLSRQGGQGRRRTAPLGVRLPDLLNPAPMSGREWHHQRMRSQVARDKQTLPSAACLSCVTRRARCEGPRP